MQWKLFLKPRKYFWRTHNDNTRTVFESLIEYIDAAIDAKRDDSGYFSIEREKSAKKELKESLSKFAETLFYG
jgi:hypothetical protein